MAATLYEHSLAHKLPSKCSISSVKSCGPAVLTCVSTAPKLALAASSVAVPTWMRPAAASRKANPSCTRLLWLAVSCVAVGDSAAVSSGLSAIAIRCTASTPTVLPTWHEAASEINKGYQVHCLRAHRHACTGTQHHWGAGVLSGRSAMAVRGNSLKTWLGMLSIHVLFLRSHNMCNILPSEAQHLCPLPSLQQHEGTA